MTTASEVPMHVQDLAPGSTPQQEESAATRLRSYAIGLALSLGLTAASFWAASTHLIYGPAISVALMTLAIGQIGIHLVFFLHITTAPDNTNNVLALGFGIMIVFFVVVGSLWIMAHLNHMTTTMPELMQMQP